MSLVAGTSLGRYVITEPIGSGGMGEVYRGDHDAIGAMHDTPNERCVPDGGMRFGERFAAIHNRTAH